MRHTFILLGWLLCRLRHLPKAAAQEWKHEINTTMCNWNGARGFQLQQTIILNGGSLWWQSGYSDGSYAAPENDENSRNTFYSLSLAHPFHIDTTNLSSLFTRGPSPITTEADFEDGAMFGNDREILLYGGLTRPTGNDTPPRPRELLGYRSPQPGSIHGQGTFFNSSLPDNMTQYVTNGGQISVPSENLGFYFGGMRGQNWGPITSDDGSANTTASTLIMVNLTDAGDSKYWRNSTLPSFVTSRANAQLVWIPASELGVLVVIGGVENPESLYPSGLSSSLKQQNAVVDIDFLHTIPLYDIAQDEWYLQNVTGEAPPKGRASFCSLLASASDRSSHNIYIYGGYDGQDSMHAPYDDVYILSLPSFVWIKARAGSSQYGRSGHQCFGVLPSQMLVVGGLYQDPSLCLQGGPIRVFNLNELDFQANYSPTVVDPYQVPAIVRKQIGGTAEGNATRRGSEQWGDSRLKKLFDIPYTKPIATWYPYTTPTTATGTQSTAFPSHSHHHKTWVIPVAVGVTILAAVAASTAIIWLTMKRERHLSRGKRFCGARVCRWLDVFCRKPEHLAATEADGVPIESTAPTGRFVREVGGEVCELPTQHTRSGASNRSSLAETPVAMYFPGSEAR